MKYYPENAQQCLKLRRLSHESQAKRKMWLTDWTLEGSGGWDLGYVTEREPKQSRRAKISKECLLVFSKGQLRVPAHPVPASWNLCLPDQPHQPALLCSGGSGSSLIGNLLSSFLRIGCREHAEERNTHMVSTLHLKHSHTSPWQVAACLFVSAKTQALLGTMT